MKLRTRSQRTGLSTPATEPASTPSSSGARGPVDDSPQQRYQEHRIAQLNALVPAASSGGLPEQLTRGIAALSGEDLSDVRVHRASASPARLHAEAFAQGRDIHVAPGKESHLPHEAWHIVQQRQGRVRPTGQVGGQALNDDPRLELEADAMGGKAMQMKRPALDGSPRQFHTSRPVLSTAGGIAQAWAEEDGLIARLRGLDTVLGVYKSIPNEQILNELEELTAEIERKEWSKAAAVMKALRRKHGIDQLSPPQMSIGAPEVYGGDFILESSRAIPLAPDTNSDLKPRPGSRRIELGAGDMASAATLGAKDEFTAYTEFRSEEDTRKEYNDRLDENLEKFEQTSKKTNAIKFGVDATQEGPYEGLPLTENLRFTNPNLGHDDIKARVREMILAPLDDEDSDLLYLSSMGIGFWLDGKRLKQYKQKPPKDGWQFPLISSTTNTISSVRNVYMLQKFLTNAPAKLIPGSGKVEIIVSASYLKSWPILKIASDMGYKAAVQNPYDLGFENVKTQKSEAVKTEKPAQKCLITLYLPWGDALFKTHSMSWVDQFTSVQTSLLVQVSAPD